MKYFVENQKRLSEVSDRFKEAGYLISPIEGLCHCGKAQAVAVLTDEEDLDIQIIVCQACHDSAPLIQQL